MSMSDLRSWWSDRRNTRAASLHEAAGKDASFESLETRVLLSDPGSTFDEAQELVLDGNGQAVYDDKLPDGSDIDMYKFSVSSPDFVTVLADALNGGDPIDDRVDTQLTLYRYDGVVLATSTGNGSLTGGTPTEAWHGFVPQASHLDAGTGLYTYFVAVSAQNPPTGSAEGFYSFRVDGQTTEITHGGGANEKNTAGTLTRPLEDIVYRVETDDDSVWDSVATANAKADSNVLDTRLEIYDSDGNLIVDDSQAGRLTNAFVVFKSNPDETFYFRVRSDEFLPGTPRTGGFTLGLDLVGKDVDMDPVSRQGFVSGDTGGNQKTELYQFVAQASGPAIISAQGSGMIPLLDPSMTLYDSNGDFIAFSDRFFGDSPQIESTLVGGETYYVLIDGFDFAGQGTFSLFIEANHTFDEGIPLDDHANTLDFANATPIVWSDWQVAEDNVLGQGPLVDHSLVSLGSATGRIHRGSDTDMFVFVPPVDMLGDYAGNLNDEVDEDMDGETDRDGDAVQDAIPVTWYETFRPATRVEIQVQAFEDPGAPSFSWLTPAVRVYDSNGDIVYDLNLDTFDDVLIPPLDFAGSLDPARYYGDLDFGTLGVDYADGVEPFEGVFSLEVWGGEPYYIEVSGVSGSGRYNAWVSVDGMPNPSDSTNWSTINSEDPVNPGGEAFDGIADDTGTHIVSGIVESTNNFSNSPTDFAGARTIDLGVADGGFTGPTGSSNAFLDGSAGFERAYVSGKADFASFWTFPASIADQVGATLLAGKDTTGLVLGDFDNTGVAVLQESGLAGIEHPLDNDLYTFRAAANGYAEVRINTTALNDWFQEFIADGEGELVDSEADDGGFYFNDDMEIEGDFVTPTSNLKEKTYNSILDSALRIFDNDFEQIAFNDDNNAISGVTQDINAGNQGTRTFHERDARIVFPITKGEIYYIQVESGQADDYTAWQSDPTLPVAWQHMIGSYEMLLHTVPTISNDDYPDLPNDDATAFGIDESTGSGSISGEIDNNSTNPVDVDVFTFIAPKSGPFTVTAERQDGESLIPDLAIYRVSGGQTEQVASGTASSQGSITLEVEAEKGERFYIEVLGAGSTEGLYDITVEGFTVEDDHADWLEFQNATEIELLDFLGSASGEGSIESNGDSDVFKFSTGDFTDATITVAGTGESGALNPTITLYEVSVDPFGNPVLLRIDTNDDLSGETTDAQIVVGLTPDRVSADTGLEYPFYYLVVRGSDADNDEGDYTIDFEIDATDDHPDAGQLEFATPIGIDNEIGQGSDTGTIEILGDSDLLRFTALAAGTARVTVSRPSGSVFLPKISILDGDGNALDVSDGAVPGTVETEVTRGQIYYVLIEASTIASGDARLGDWTVNVITPPLDDHANAGEWSIATTLRFDENGDAILGTQTEGDPLNPAINVVDDTDLFTFVTIASGNITVTFDPLDDTAIGLRPELSVFDADLNLVQKVTANTAGETVSIVLTDTVASERYYVLVGDALGNRTGEYQLTVDGQGSGGGGGGNGDIDFDDATEIDLDPINADGTTNGVIAQAGERDLYTFTAVAGGSIFVQLVTPRGSLLDGTITILDAETETAVVTSDATGIPGVNAAVRFESEGAGKEYWIIVDGIGTGVGSYTIKVDAEPEVYRLFTPRGFTGSTVREFVSLNNPNEFSVTYSIILRYETGARDQVIVSNATLAAGSRGGVTISDGKNGSPVNARNEPYAVVIEAVGGPVAATMAHYDFGSSIGEAFTNEISPVWNFGRIERNPGNAADFLIYYNPHDFDVSVTLTGFDANGSTVDVTTTVGALRRGGLNINQVLNLPTGIFGAQVIAEPVDSANDAEFQGVIAAVSHYELDDTAAWGIVGDPTAGTLNGSVPRLTQGDEVTSEVVIFNPNSFVTTVTLNGEYIRADLPALSRVLTVNPGEARVLTGEELGFVRNQPLGLTYTATFPITVLGSQTQNGDADATAAATRAATGWFFGAGFMNSQLAGELYLETLSVYNPANTSAEVTIDLYFFDGTTDALTILVDASGFSEINLHEVLGKDFESNTNRPANFDSNTVLGRPGLSYFSVEASSPSPFVITFTHYDLFLQGGWTNGGAPLGPLTPLTSIV